MDPKEVQGMNAHWNIHFNILPGSKSVFSWKIMSVIVW